jgi:hypothetical protein
MEPSKALDVLPKKHRSPSGTTRYNRDDRPAGVSIRGIFENELLVIRPVGRFPAHCLGVLPRAGFLRIAISAESVRRVRSASGKARRSDILLLRRTESRSLFRRTSCGVLQRTGSLYGENQRSEGSLGRPIMARDNADHRRFASIKRAVARTLQSGLD